MATVQMPISEEEHLDLEKLSNITGFKRVDVIRLAIKLGFDENNLPSKSEIVPYTGPQYNTLSKKVPDSIKAAFMEHRKVTPVPMYLLYRWAFVRGTNILKEKTRFDAF